MLELENYCWRCFISRTRWKSIESFETPNMDHTDRIFSQKEPRFQISVRFCSNASELKYISNAEWQRPSRRHSRKGESWPIETTGFFKVFCPSRIHNLPPGECVDCVDYRYVLMFRNKTWGSREKFTKHVFLFQKFLAPPGRFSETQALLWRALATNSRVDPTVDDRETIGSKYQIGWAMMDPWDWYIWHPNFQW